MILKEKRGVRKKLRNGERRGLDLNSYLCNICNIPAIGSSGQENEYLLCKMQASFPPEGPSLAPCTSPWGEASRIRKGGQRPPLIALRIPHPGLGRIKDTSEVVLDRPIGTGMISRP
jgi:hypothetical protein